MKGGKETDRPTFDRADEIGEDPYKYLYVGEVVDQQEHRYDGEGDPLAMAKARIAGIERMDRIQAWIDAEAQLGPRVEVMKHLNTRKMQLEADADQPARADSMTRQAAADGGVDE